MTSESVVWVRIEANRMYVGLKVVVGLLRDL